MDAKDTLYEVLRNCSVEEIEYLRLTIVEGRLDGRYYGPLEVLDDKTKQYIPKCGCVLGTLDGYRRGIDKEDGHTFWDNITIRLGVGEWGERYDPTESPIEELARKIEVGDTPETNEYSAQLLAWVDEYLAGSNA